MEHRFRLKFLILLTLAIQSLTTLVSCRDPNPNPEQLDPIFIDLGNQLKTANSDIKDQDDAIVDLKNKLAALEALDPVRGQMRRELAKREAFLVQLKQRALYLEIRQGQRKDFDQVDYKKAFDADQAWPNPAEIAEYKKRQALRNASPNWNDRVPKDTRYSKNPSAQVPAKPTAEKPAHGEHE